MCGAAPFRTGRERGCRPDRVGVIQAALQHSARYAVIVSCIPGGSFAAVAAPGLFIHTVPLMSYRSLYIFLFLALAAAACSDTRREEELSRRETALLQREKSFALKEADYHALLHMRDSLLAVADSVAPPAAWPEGVAGTWNSRLVCRESDCREYVIGDQRTDSWEFTTDSTGLYVKVLSNNKLVRVFRGETAGNQLQLRYSTDSAAAVTTDISVSLDPADSLRMKGVQTLSRGNGCVAKFSVELSRDVKN